MTNVNAILKEARKNLVDKAVKDYVKQVEALLKQRTAAVKIVKNLDRDIEELKLKIQQELDDTGISDSLVFHKESDKGI